MSNDNEKSAHETIGADASSRRRQSRARRHFRIRKHIAGTPERPRLVVNRSSRHIHVQVIDDQAGHTIAAASSMETEVQSIKGDKKARSAKVGALIAERVKATGVETIVFDRGGNRYQGRIAALAEAAREGGLTF